VVYALAQTHGKGHAENRWESEPGMNLTASMVLYPEFLKPENQFFLTMVVSLSVCSVLDGLQMSNTPMIKWPNDIYLNHRKIAGILIKNDLMGNRISNTIVGMGLNINQLNFNTNLPDAVSIKMITGKNYEITEILTEWHRAMAGWYGKLMGGETDAIEKAYLNRFYLLNEPAWFVIKGKKVQAVIRGLAKYGMLHLTGIQNEEYTCDLKEIVFCRNIDNEDDLPGS